MDWKEFLKPDKKKIILWLLIFLCVPWPFFWDCIPCPRGAYCVMMCKPGREFMPPILLFLTLYPRDVIEQVNSLLMCLLFSYFLSCLIVWIYDKLTRKRKIEV